VLLMHHSPQHQRIKLGIDSASRTALEKFVKNHEVSVLVTGHTHDSKCQTTHYTNATSSWTLLEARCGTTTQRDVLPQGWRPRNPALFPNSFLVHRIFSDYDSGELVWTTNLYERDETEFFDKHEIGRTHLWPR
jgi:hypothetical protein